MRNGLKQYGTRALGAIIAYSVYAVGCSSTPAPPAPLTGSLHGTYFALSDSLISEITFEDATHYSLLKSGCAGEQVDGAGDIGCTQTGTYSLNNTLGQLSLTDTVSGQTQTLPFKVDSVEQEAAGSVGPLGGALINDGGSLVKPSMGDGGTSIVQCFNTALTEGNSTSTTYGLHCPNTSMVSSDGILARAELWVAANLPYCQAANHQHDGDKSCASTCNRPGEPAAWDPYRSDCSGFVSWAWGLPPPGRSTGQFGDVSKSISGNDLQPGDALVNPSTHIILFIQWSNSSHTSAIFQEEPGCSAHPPNAHQYTSSVTISGSRVTVAWNHETFNAIRYNKLCASNCPFNNDGGTQNSQPATGDSGGNGGGTGAGGGGTGTGAGGTGPGTGGSGTGTGMDGGSGDGGPSCGSGLTLCGGTCENLQSDLHNCGSCGIVCPAGEPADAGADAGDAGHVAGQCVKGWCGLPCTNDATCNPGSTGSGMICSSSHICVVGCHTTTQCPGGLTCQSGACGDGMACTSDATCNPGSKRLGMICTTPDKCVPGCRNNSLCPVSTVCVDGECR